MSLMNCSAKDKLEIRSSLDEAINKYNGFVIEKRVLDSLSLGIKQVLLAAVVMGKLDKHLWDCDHSIYVSIDDSAREVTISLPEWIVEELNLINEPL
jgi:hypothetical protein